MRYLLLSQNMETHKIAQQFGIAALYFLDFVLKCSIECLMMSAHRNEKHQNYPIHKHILNGHESGKSCFSIISIRCSLIPWQTVTNSSHFHDLLVKYWNSTIAYSNRFERYTLSISKCPWVLKQERTVSVVVSMKFTTMNPIYLK